MHVVSHVPVLRVHLIVGVMIVMRLFVHLTVVLYIHYIALFIVVVVTGLVKLDIVRHVVEFKQF